MFILLKIKKLIKHQIQYENYNNQIKMDYDRVNIFDNFLTYDELEKCSAAYSKPAWSFGQISQTSPISTPFWMMTLDSEPFFTKDLLLKIENVTKKKYALQRVYANGQTFGQDGTYHQDDTSDESYTFCLFVNKQITNETVDNIGGEFIFKIPIAAQLPNATGGLNHNFSRIVVEPIYNRGILFPSNVFHKGLAFNRYSKGLRISIAWKLKLQ
jgi:hypothetical protein